jgi:hypothetical protein
MHMHREVVVVVDWAGVWMQRRRSLHEEQVIFD